MHFSRFCSEVQALLKAELPSAADLWLEGPESCRSVTVRTPADILYPSMSLAGFYDAFMQGTPLSVIVRRILSVYAAETLHPFCTSSDLGSRSTFLKSLGLRPASLRLHRSLLPLLPHAVFHDMLFFFTASLPGNDSGIGTAVVTSEIAGRFKLSDGALLKAAAAASAARSPAAVFPLPVFLEKLSREFPEDGRRVPVPDGHSPGSSFYVLTNDEARFGAAVLLYPGTAEDLYRRFGPYYLLPSSVHELLILPEKESVDRAELKRLIRSSNRSLGDSLLILSDELYACDPANGLHVC